MAVKSKPHVFLSHVSEDHERVERLAAALEARGVLTWIDRQKIKPGMRWENAIEAAIREGALFVACFSQAYAARTRSYMNEELMVAFEEEVAPPRGGDLVHPAQTRRLRDPGSPYRRGPLGRIVPMGRLGGGLGQGRRGTRSRGRPTDRAVIPFLWASRQ
jgi:hypothetical protein